MQRALTPWSVSILLALGCSGAAHDRPPPQHPDVVAKPEPTPAETEPAITPLRSGTLAPIEHPEPLAARALGRCVSGDLELLEIELPQSIAESYPVPRQTGDAFWNSPARNAVPLTAVTLEPASGETTRDLGFATFGDDDGSTKPSAAAPKDRLWLRRPKASAGTPLSVQLFTAAREQAPGHHYVIQVTADALHSAACKDPQRYGRAFRRYLARRQESSFYTTGKGSAFGAFALERLGAIFGPAGAPSEADTGTRDDTELVDLMRLFSGEDSIEAALQRRKSLRVGSSHQTAIVALTSIAAPRLSKHPWTQMLAALPGHAAPEPMASVTPADFYFVRARGIDGLFQLLDEGEAWLDPLAHLTGEGTSDVLARYETALGLKTTALSRALGSSVVEDVACVGSDPSLALGSDLTLLFRVKNDAVFGAQLAANLNEYAAQHGALTRSEISYAGVSITLLQSTDHAVHQYSAAVTGLTLISNSLAATEHVIDAALGKAPRLAEEPDFQYLLARDAGTDDDVLAYMGDRFIERTISPAVRIQGARRWIAQSELRRPGYAALLYGWLNGHEPETLADLTRSKLLLPADLRHFDAQPIHFEIGQTATSAWGTSTELAPLIDLPALTKVTPGERDAYQQFRSEYESLWSDAIDPIALRFRFVRSGDATTLSARLRVLPLVREHDYREVQELVGDVRLAPGSVQSGLRALFGIAADSELRRDLSGTSRDFLGGRFGLDWLGRWGMLGLADHNGVANAFAQTSDVPELPAPSDASSNERHEIDALAQLPLYAGLEVKSGAGAALALAVVREKLEDGSLHWQPDQKYRGLEIHEVRSDDLTAAHIYYVLTPRALFFSLSAPTLRHLIDQEMAGELPSTSDTAARQGQFVVDFSARAGGGLLTSLIWAFEREARTRSREAAENAEILFYGAPRTQTDDAAFRELGRRYLGVIPTTPEDRLYRFTSSGARDELRGNAFAPAWPTLPIADSPLARALEGLGTVRTQMGFEPEPGPEPTTTSLAISIELTRRRTKP